MPLPLLTSTVGVVLFPAAVELVSSRPVTLKAVAPITAVFSVTEVWLDGAAVPAAALTWLGNNVRITAKAISTPSILFTYE